jgi:lipopolysaccharide heptosyltransferase I
MARILVVRLSSIGDIVHTLPAVAALGRSLADAEIAWAIESRFAPLVEGNPFVRRIIRLDTLGWRAEWASSGTLREARRSISELRGVKAGVAVDFQGLMKSAVLTRLSGAKRRVGFGGRWLRERLAGGFYTERVEGEARRHVIEENLALVERLGARAAPRTEWEFPLPRPQGAEREVEARLKELGAEKFVVLNPGAGWMSKRWPPDRYAKLAGLLATEDGWTVLLTGSADEEGTVREIAGQARNARVAYFRSTLLEFIALARRASVVLAGDTGPLHLAAAVRTPVVALYGPTDPARNGPFAPGDIVLRARRAQTFDDGRGRAHWDTGQAKRAAHLDDFSVEEVRSAIRERLATADGA